MTRVKASPFGRLLRHWRTVRGASQLRLATEAGTSTRHLSFVETGRSQPSREMVVRLAEALDIPLRERNVLLSAAGFAPLYRESVLEAPEMKPVERALAFLLERHEPFPAYLVDRGWNVLRANRAATAAMSAFAGAAALWTERPANLMRLVLHPDGLRRHVVNWNEVAVGLLGRLEREVALAGQDEELRDLLDDLLGLPDVPSNPADFRLAPTSDPVMPVHLKNELVELRLFSVMTCISSPLDVTVQDLRIESFMPADAATEARLRELADDA